MKPRSRPSRVAALIGLLLAGLAAGCDESGTQDEARVARTFGGTGMGPGEFSYPRAAVTGSQGRLYVVDKTARIQCFTPEGEFLFEWQMPEWQAGKPTGLGAGPDGRIYAADTHYSRVVVFEADGALVGQFGTRGEGPGQFVMPTDVAVDDDGFIYVSEYGGNDRINKFTPDWQYLFSFGGPGSGLAELRRPQELLLDGQGSLWAADACNHRICRFGLEGEFRGSFGRSGTAAGELRFPYGLDQLSDGTLVACEYGNNRLQRFDLEGVSLGTWGRAGRGPGELAYPWAVAVGARDRAYVVDSGNNRIQVFSGLEADAWQRP